MRRVRVYERMLEREREKLGRLIDATMDEPIALNGEILTQSKRVDDLIALIQETGEGGQKRAGARLRGRAPVSFGVRKYSAQMAGKGGQTKIAMHLLAHDDLKQRLHEI